MLIFVPCASMQSNRKVDPTGGRELRFNLVTSFEGQNARHKSAATRVVQKFPITSDHTTFRLPPQFFVFVYCALFQPPYQLPAIPSSLRTSGDGKIVCKLGGTVEVDLRK